MADTTFTDYGSTSTGQLSPADESPQKSKLNATSEKAKVATKKAGSKPSSSEARLSILQNAFEQWLESGGGAGIGSGGGEIHLFLQGVHVCGNCKFWTVREICPACGK